MVQKRIFDTIQSGGIRPFAPCFIQPEVYYNTAIFPPEDIVYRNRLVLAQEHLIMYNFDPGSQQTRHLRISGYVIDKGPLEADGSRVLEIEPIPNEDRRNLKDLIARTTKYTEDEVKYEH